jgi:phage tail protein X
MPSSIYVTIQNDRLDKICRATYGSERGGTVEAVLNANRGLAALGPLYPAGTKITLPDLGTPQLPIKQTINLWT